MDALTVTAPAPPACGSQPDAIEACFAAVWRAGDDLAIARINRWRDERLQGVLVKARDAAALVGRLDQVLADAFAPATEAEVGSEGARLLRAWPQAKHGDLAGFGAELALMIIERRPSRRALQQACRALKLTKVHLPAIAEVIGALDAAEKALQVHAGRLADLPRRIALAEADLAPPRAAPSRSHAGAAA